MQMPVFVKTIRSLGIILPLLISLQLHSTNYYVNDASATGDIFCSAIGNNGNNGTSSSTPKLTLTNLLSSVTLLSGDSIKIDAGIYYNDAKIDFYISGITFLGAGSELTIFDNNSAGSGFNYFMYIGSSNVTLKNFTLRKYYDLGTAGPGTINGQAITIGGGGSGIVLENLIMTNNGGSGGNPSIVVLANTSVTIRGGGGVCNVWRSSYTGGIEANGNGITLNIENYGFGYNYKTGSYDGGGLLIDNCNTTTTVNVKNCRFFNNEASDGGGISQRGGVLNATDCIFDANLAGQASTPIYGGAVRMTGGTATFLRCVFTNNKLGSAGGTLRGAAIGLYSLDANIVLTIVDCLFSGNVGAEGDDLYADKYSAKTINVHVTNTTFSTTADAIYNKDADHIHLTNCGNPPVAGTNSPAVSKDNTFAPSLIPNPTTPSISGDCATGIILPVNLSFFKGMCSKNRISLSWQTSSEINNNFFLIEKSADATFFNSIGQISGSGNTNNLTAYQFTDEYPDVNGNYYRLIQVDYDGQTTTSEMIYVPYPCAESTEPEISSLYFSDGTLHLELFSEQSQEIRISITDITGKQLHAKNIMVEEGFNSSHESAGQMNAGIYIITLSGKDFHISRKLQIN